MTANIYKKNNAPNTIKFFQRIQHIFELICKFAYGVNKKTSVMSFFDTNCKYLPFFRK